MRVPIYHMSEQKNNRRPVTLSIRKDLVEELFDICEKNGWIASRQVEKILEEWVRRQKKKDNAGIA